VRSEVLIGDSVRLVRNREQILEWERRWRVPVAIATFLAVALMIVSQIVSPISGNGNAAVLRSVIEHSDAAALSGIMRAVGLALLIAPLFYLFRAVQARSSRVRTQLVGLVVIAPLFLAVSSGLTVAANNEAADLFVAGEAKSTLSAKEAHQQCVSDRKDEGAKSFAEEFKPAQGETVLAACEKRKIEDDEASNAIGEASLAPVVSGLGIAGTLGLVVSLFYCGLYGMRTGLLSRFWGSLGMVAGIAFLLGPLFIVTLIWFVYFGLLVLGTVPGGRPPAWEKGEAVPWPTPGEKAAAELEPSEGRPNPEPDADADGSSERRKRKARDPGQSD
jgi:hypothetical protein